MSRIALGDIVAVVRRDGETGSHRDPKWNSPIEILGNSLDDAIAATLAEKSLADLLDETDD